MLRGCTWGWTGLVLSLSACATPGHTTPAHTTPAHTTPAHTVPAHTTTLVGRTIDPSFDVQGHRGARGLRPENTLPAIEVALDAGVSTLELDLHLTRDDMLVVWHDPVIQASKCTGADLDPDGKPPRIRGLYVRELAEFVCDQNPDPERFSDQRPDPTPLAGADFRIRRLEAVLDFLDAYAESGHKTRAQRDNAAEIRLNLELKRKEGEPWRIDDGFDGVRPAVFEHAVIRLIRDRGLVQRVTVQSFDHRSLAAIHSVAPGIVLAALTQGEVDLGALRDLGASIWSPHHETLTPARVDQAHALGLRVVPWTVNNAARISALIDMNVDGVITDLGGDVTLSRFPRGR